MRHSVHAVVFGSIAVFFGVAETFAPALVLRAYGMSADPGAVAVVRLAAAVMLGFGFAVVLSRRSRDLVARRAVLVSGVVYGLASGVASAQLALSGAASAMIWTNLLIDVPLVANATWLLVTMKASSTAGADA